MTYSVEVYCIVYDFTVDGRHWYDNQQWSSFDRGKANVKWLELKADKNVSRIRTSIEVVEKEITTWEDVVDAYEGGQIDYSDYVAYREDFMDAMPEELDPRR